ncbi:branched-chain-amino-acid transaminase [Nitriliruptoraceae bacterium ZYF776]|nr:branched-chain-amino-acid transaminase [Profundirhabdus halotolerans]
MAATMARSEVVDGVYGDLELGPVAPIELHPAAHALHYGSTIFEGLKAHRGTDGQVRLFRVDAHARRMVDSATRLHLPPPTADFVRDAIVAVTAANLDETPPAPGALYLRPVLIGTLQNIGAAAAPSSDALFYVVASPVGDYFSGDRGLKLWVETELPRTTPQFGRIKTGANYAMALGPTLARKAEHGVDQILFAPDGQVQETGAANALLLSEGRIVTRALDDTFLHGVTRDTVLTLARDLGMTVEERDVPVEELYDWVADGGEVALSGTAAVLAGVGTLVDPKHGEVAVTGGMPGPVTTHLRETLLAVQRGEADDPHGWTQVVTAADA